jgi:hypothetical protein
MARVLVKKDDDWYDQLASLSNYYEVEIEDRVLKHSNNAFRGYYVLPFKIIIESSVGSAKPDLVFVREDYRDWIIVEVELYDHAKTHPEMQVDVFKDAKYDHAKVVPYLLKQHLLLDKNKLTKMVKDIQPKVMVIVDAPNAKWIEDFRRKGILVCIFEVFKGTNGYELYRINGDYPYVFTSKSHLINLRNPQPGTHYYQFHDPNFIKEGHGELVTVYFKQSELKGKIIVDKAIKYLIVQSSPIPERKELIIGIDVNGKYIIELN